MSVSAKCNTTAWNVQMIQQAWSRSLDRSSSHPQAQQQTWPSPRCRCGSAAIVCMCWGGGSGVKTRPRRRTPRGEGQKDVDTNQLHQSPQQTISHLSLTSSHPHPLPHPHPHPHPHILTPISLCAPQSRGTRHGQRRGFCHRQRGHQKPWLQRQRAGRGQPRRCRQAPCVGPCSMSRRT